MILAISQVLCIEGLSLASVSFRFVARLLSLLTLCALPHIRGAVDVFRLDFL